MQDFFYDEFVRMAILIFAIGFAFAAALFVGLPWLWSVLKPVIHSLTGA